NQSPKLVGRPNRTFLLSIATSRLFSPSNSIPPSASYPEGSFSAQTSPMLQTRCASCSSDINNPLGIPNKANPLRSKTPATFCSSAGESDSTGHYILLACESQCSTVSSCSCAFPQ